MKENWVDNSLFFCYNIIKEKKDKNIMRYQLINKPNKNFSTIEQILYNRGIKSDKISHYLNLSD